MTLPMKDGKPDLNEIQFQIKSMTPNQSNLDQIALLQDLLTWQQEQLIKPIIIGLGADGWNININNRVYRWNHNEEDLGTTAISTLFKDLGYPVKLEEHY